MTSMLAAAALASLLAAPPAPTGAEPAAAMVLEAPPPEASGASGRIDPAVATRAYLSRQSPAERARSDAYFEGGYWFILVDLLWSSAIYLALLATGASTRMRDLAARRIRSQPLRAAVYWAQFLLVTTAIAFPLAWYRDHVREHRYGLSNLSFGGWLAEQGKALALGLLLGGLAVAVLYAVLARAGRRWWAWGAAVSVAFVAVSIVITPVFIVPVFNHPTPLADERVKGPVLSLARASGIGASDVWQVDASKQSNRISADVSGFLGTQRITLNDNLLRRCSLPEIEVVMAHEMGHYVLNHVPKFLLQYGLVILVGFAAVAALFDRLCTAFPGWGVQGVSDPAGLPLLLLLVGVYMFLATPVLNAMIRSQEIEADLYALQAARQPDGFAQVALKLGEYRKLDPGPLEEALLFDHPSGRARIFAAMRWKAEHPETWSRP